ncbi:MAG: SMC-Scp complex subunit ScpB [Erysipelotrichaceae bacterium]|nr:SMC-Scp complex subunit ScpB [Erysipelotrichaceae bacterium]
MIADLSGVLDEAEEDWRLDDSLQVISSESDDIESFGEQAEITVTVEEEINEEQPQDPGDEESFLHLAAVLEGLLFLTGDEGMTARQAEETLGTGSEYTARLFDYLQQYYNADERGIELARFGETWRFLSKASIHEYARKLFQINKTNKLSNAALETLAIIAYKQPITRVEIEELRGVGADVMLRKLEARGLIREAGRSEAPGRPILYAVTDEFMDAFQLLSLDELPELPQFSQEQEGSDDLFTQ